MNTKVSKIREGFIYQFQVGDEIEFANSLNESDRISAECNIVDVIYESFVVTADHDYLTARILVHSQLYRGFYWAAAQTIEKYLKAFLLLRGESVKSDSHGVVALYAKASAHDATLQNLDISPHDQVGIPDYALSHVTIFTVSDFLRDIDKYGRPDNRYNSFGVDFNSGHLFAFDHFVYSFRTRIEAPGIWKSMKDVDVSLLDALKRDNPWFATGAHALPDSSKVPVLVRLVMTVTKLDFLVEHIKNPSYRLALQWLNRMMQLPVELRRKIEKK